MKRRLQLAAVLIALAFVISWAAAGASRGWTKTKVEVKILDPVTGIEGVSYKNKFVPGLDFLGGGVLLSAALGTASIFVRKTNQNH